MALVINDVQLTKLHLAAEGTAVTTIAECVAAIAGGEELVGIQSLGDTSVTKSTQEFSAIDTNDVSYSQGTNTIETKDMSVLFNSADVAGQADLKAMFINNTKHVFIASLTDGTYETFTGFSTKSGKSFEKGSAYMYMSTIQPTTIPLDVIV